MAGVGFNADADVISAADQIGPSGMTESQSRSRDRSEPCPFLIHEL